MSCFTLPVLSFMVLAQMAQPHEDAPKLTEAPLVRALEPLSVRGVNYYPQDTPWDGFWSDTPESVMERDMALAAGLNINTVRIFIPWNEKTEQAGLIDAEGTVDPVYIAKVDRFLEIAWGHGIRAVVCFCFEYHGPPLRIPGEEAWKRAMGAFAGHFKDDGRILMWDLINEPERFAPPEKAGDGDFSGHAGVRAYLAEAVPWIKTVDPNHLTTVGLGWRVDLLDPEALPDVLQYHHYSPKEELFEQGTDRVRTVVENFRKHGGDRPVLIGEFGISTARDSEHGAGEAWAERLGPAPGTEEEQARLFGIILDAAEEFGLPGVMPWTLHSFHAQETGWLTPVETMYGLFRLDLTPKPAALLARERYARWGATGKE
jgi:endo-1,4-beta-mannosidase